MLHLMFDSASPKSNVSWHPEQISMILEKLFSMRLLMGQEMTKKLPNFCGLMYSLSITTHLESIGV